MKKLIVLFCFVTSWLSANSQFYVTSSNSYLIINDLPNIDAVFLINGIDASTEIGYAAGAENVEWRLYDGSFYSNQYSISPDDATGYILRLNGTDTYWVWVIDYSLYPVSFNGLQVSANNPDLCRTLNINALLNVPDLVYYDKNNARCTLTRSFSLNYTDYNFNGEAWEDSICNSNHTYPFSQISVNAPKKDATFLLSGDNYAEVLGINDSIMLDYQAVAVETHVKGTVEQRIADNEIEKDSSEPARVKGSGPLVVYFESRANTPTAAFFEWIIYNQETPLNYVRYNDENVRYTFQQYGDYVAKLTAQSTGGCIAVDSIFISVLQSSLDVPNAFSPDGNGTNDEFRVSYKSLASFKMVVFNRWGQVVYSSTDPSKGWDGRINSRDAAEGTYYYIIEATGTDKESTGKNKGKPIKYNKKGHVSLFRVKGYKK